MLFQYVPVHYSKFKTEMDVVKKNASFLLAELFSFIGSSVFGGNLRLQGNWKQSICYINVYVWWGFIISKHNMVSEIT